MEIIYKAFDGTHFKTEEECRKYECKAAFSMWDLSGRLTDDVTSCMVVHFPDCEGASAFINISREADTTTDGIDCGDHGWFFWDDFNGEYHYVEDGIIDALRKIFAEKPRR